MTYSLDFVQLLPELPDGQAGSRQTGDSDRAAATSSLTGGRAFYQELGRLARRGLELGG